jgi:serine/threonine-protein kinase
MDFGIARMRVSDVQTQTGAILGSPKYMSPEVVTGTRADHRADLFSLGIVLYELATGTPPFESPNLTELMQQIATRTELPPSSIERSLPDMLDLIVAKALRKDPGARYQSAAELAADLRACAAGPPGAQGLGAESTVILLDGADVGAKTALLEQATTVPLGGQGATVTRTRAGDPASGTGSPLTVSRRFDSSQAMERLRLLSAAADANEHGGLAASPSPPGRAAVMFERIRQDPDRRNAGLAIIAAGVIALIIALV